MTSPAMELDHDSREPIGQLRHGQTTRSKSLFLVCSYLFAIVAANLITTAFGPAASVFSAFAFIGLDLTARDGLHEAWHGKHLALKMAALIAAGSALSWLINRDAGPVAVASFAAFGAAAIVDTLVYQWLYRLPWRVKVNASNLASAAVDSFIFPTLAFGGVMWAITLGQFAAKVLGGFVWSLLLKKPANNGLHASANRAPREA